MRLFVRLIDWSGKSAAAALILLVLLIVYDATVRYLFHSGSLALQELEWHLFDVIILLSIAYTFSHDGHVRVDIFYEHFSPKTKAIVNLLGSLFFVLPFSLLIIYLGIDFVQLSFSQMEASADPGGLPYRFIIKSFVPIAFILMMVQTLRVIVASYNTVRGV
ncbi:TRAP transporter small permease subunit [Sulfuricurvum sp.]|uniref:TRAP transporter small permease subunit n=1 Tax=Sulfuricurvum sp. TaxID=2025608 RepID=UPI0026074463|nr:TRAP transporter small permease subunit [Sulfuricurvum sp.]MDD2781772.1 TRAP transporter small permease subunit [Sulfuricurvum sp.]